MEQRSDTSARVSIGLSLRITAAIAGLTVSASVAATGWFANSDWNSLNNLSQSQGVYTRSGPDVDAAFHIPVGRSEINVGAETTEQPTLDLEIDNSERKRDELQIWGPWLSETGVSDNARQLVQFLETSARHGLSPKAYGLAMLKNDIAAREHAATIATFESAGERAKRPANQTEVTTASANSIESIDVAKQEGERLERLLDATFVRVTRHLGQGTVDPRKTQRHMYRDAPQVDTASIQNELAAGGLDVNAALRSVMPGNAGYRRLVSHMDQLLADRASSNERTHVPEIGTLRVGHHHDNVMEIKRRLLETGELEEGTILTPMFDAPLKLAVESFQERNGIPSSGIVDARTRRKLNTDINEAIADVALSLERWRWMPRDLGDRHFFMNLPSYRLSMIDDGEQIVDMNVVIGAVEHQTPNFSRNMSYIDVNPTWTVPQSIAQRELLPKELASPGYLRKRNFDFLQYRDGTYRRVAYDSVTPEAMRERPFKYVLRQRAGSNNALGTMKFMMPNQYAIYFHDTQAKSLFSLPDRAFSHGCIRLSEPKGLLRTVLEADGKSPSQINRALAYKKTRSIILSTPVPTHLAYFTTWVDKEGYLQTRNDVYSHDAALKEALRAVGTLLTDIDDTGVTASAERHVITPTHLSDQG